MEKVIVKKAKVDPKVTMSKAKVDQLSYYTNWTDEKK
jgi:hypothetical protein